MSPAERRRSIAERADSCAKWLKVQGFDVLRIEPGSCGPRVIIKASPLCKKLEGAVAAFCRTKSGEQRFFFAYRFDCEVRWADEQRGAL